MLAISECRRQQDTRSPNDDTWTIRKVHDGDTVTVVDENGHAEKIRLADIDAPEYRQPYGKIARDALARKLDQVPFQVKITRP